MVPTVGGKCYLKIADVSGNAGNFRFQMQIDIRMVFNPLYKIICKVSDIIALKREMDIVKISAKMIGQFHKMDTEPLLS